MFMSMMYECPYLKGSGEGARCDAALCCVENNLIKKMEDIDIKVCINKKRRFEVCYIYWNKLRMTAANRLIAEIPLLDGRPHAFGSL